MNIQRKKEKKEQPVIIPRITRLPTWFEPTKKHFISIVWYALEMVWYALALTMAMMLLL
jgi:hypothetical protein